MFFLHCICCLLFALTMICSSYPATYIMQDAFHPETYSDTSTLLAITSATSYKKHSTMQSEHEERAPLLPRMRVPAISTTARTLSTPLTSNSSHTPGALSVSSFTYRRSVHVPTSSRVYNDMELATHGMRWYYQDYTTINWVHGSPDLQQTT
jgi:hypothetical protein